jgi:hypothetical protein
MLFSLCTDGLGCPQQAVLVTHGGQTIARRGANDAHLILTFPASIATAE